MLSIKETLEIIKRGTDEVLIENELIKKLKKKQTSNHKVWL